MKSWPPAAARPAFKHVMRRTQDFSAGSRTFIPLARDVGQCTWGRRMSVRKKGWQVNGYKPD